jgi:ABC-2 type transport system permease protein
MTEATLDAPTPGWVAQLRVTLPRVCASEWTKLRSLRSTRWTMLVALVLTIGLPLLVAIITDTHRSTLSFSDREPSHGLDVAIVGALVAQLAIGVLGVLAISTEYSTGMVRSSLVAVPRRLPMLWGKVAVFAGVCFGLTLPVILLAFFATQAIFARHDLLQLPFSSPGVARALVGGALYLTLVGVFSLALGAITRNTAGGITAFAGIFFVVPPLLHILPTSWSDPILEYMPGNAGSEIMNLSHGRHELAPWPGFAVFCAYTAIALAIAAVLLLRRDA